MNAGNSLAMNTKRISAEIFCPTTQACWLDSMSSYNIYGYETLFIGLLREHTYSLDVAFPFSRFGQPLLLSYLLCKTGVWQQTFLLTNWIAQIFTWNAPIMYLDDLVSVCHRSCEAGSEPSLFAVEHNCFAPQPPLCRKCQWYWMQQANTIKLVPIAMYSVWNSRQSSELARLESDIGGK